MSILFFSCCSPLTFTGLSFIQRYYLNFAALLLEVTKKKLFLSSYASSTCTMIQRKFALIFARFFNFLKVLHRILHQFDEQWVSTRPLRIDTLVNMLWFIIVVTIVSCARCFVLFIMRHGKHAASTDFIYNGMKRRCHENQFISSQFSAHYLRFIHRMKDLFVLHEFVETFSNVSFLRKL